MKLSKEQVRSMSNIIYKKVIDSTEWQEKINSAGKKAKLIVDMIKATNQYKAIRSTLDLPCVENVYIYLSKITNDFEGFEAKDKYPVLVDYMNMDEQIYTVIYNSLRPEFISSYEIEDRIIVESIIPRKDETPEQLVKRIAKSFLTSNDNN